MFRTGKTKGFTLVELVTVIIILGIVSIGISGFIKSGVQIFNDVTERDQILAESRFVVERLNRELRTALPNSARVATLGATQCLEFVPIQWATYYTRLPILPSSDTQANVVEIVDASGRFTLQSGDFAVVYPTSIADVYDTSNNKRQVIMACTDADDGNCGNGDPVNHLANLTLSNGFGDVSPASRLYIVRHSVSYCVSGRNMFRYQTSITPNQQVFTSGGVLMAEHIDNRLTDSAQQPFRVLNATLNRNALIQVLLAFERNEEIVNFSHDIHVPNVP